MAQLLTADRRSADDELRRSMFDIVWLFFVRFEIGERG
jgi:hypothetical protein